MSKESVTAIDTFANGRPIVEEMAENITVDELVAKALVVAIPTEHVIEHPDGRKVSYIAGRALDLADASGSSRHVEPGDLLHASGVEASRHGLRRLVRSGALVEVGGETGVVGAISALTHRIDRLERALILTACSDDDLRKLAIPTGARPGARRANPHG